MHDREPVLKTPLYNANVHMDMSEGLTKLANIILRSVRIIEAQTKMACESPSRELSIEQLIQGLHETRTYIMAKQAQFGEKQCARAVIYFRCPRKVLREHH